MARGKAARLNPHRPADPIAVAPLLAELAAQGLAGGVPRNNIRRKKSDSRPCACGNACRYPRFGAGARRTAPRGRRPHGDRARRPAYRRSALRRRCGRAPRRRRIGTYPARVTASPCGFRGAPQTLPPTISSPRASASRFFLQKILRHARMRVQTDHGVARRRAQRDVDAAGQPALRVFQQLHLKRCACGKATHDLRGVVRGGALSTSSAFQLFGRDRLREQVAQQRVEALRGVVSHDDKTIFVIRQSLPV